MVGSPVSGLFRRLRTAGVVACALALGACSGPQPRLLEQPAPGTARPPSAMAVTPDGRFSVELQQLIVRNGPGSWVSEADWDEYVVRIGNSGEESLVVTGAELISPMLPEPSAPSRSRAELEDQTRKALRFLSNAGVMVGFGIGLPIVIIAGSAGGGGGMVGAAAVGAAAAVLVPVGLVAGAVAVIAGESRVREEQAKIQAEIERRALELPVALEAGSGVERSLFFRITPAPKELNLAFSHSKQPPQTLRLDLAPLASLHLKTEKARPSGDPNRPAPSTVFER